MKTKTKHKAIQLSEQERRYISGIIEAQSTKISYMNNRAKTSESIRQESKILENLEQKLTV